MNFTVAIVGRPNVGNACSTGWSAGGSPWSTTARASPATGGRVRRGSAILSLP
jgi:hypothetical protein